MTTLRLIPASPTAPGSVREVIAWAIDDWLERTAPTDDRPGGEATTWSAADIADHVMNCLEQTGYQVTRSGVVEETT